MNVRGAPSERRQALVKAEEGKVQTGSSTRMFGRGHCVLSEQGRERGKTRALHPCGSHESGCRAPLGPGRAVQGALPANRRPPFSVEEGAEPPDGRDTGPHGLVAKARHGARRAALRKCARYTSRCRLKTFLNIKKEV